MEALTPEEVEMRAGVWTVEDIKRANKWGAQMAEYFIDAHVEAKIRAYVECYSEGKPGTELQYLIFALKIIDELRAESARVQSGFVG